MPAAQVTLVAEQQFNAAAQTFWTETMRLVQRLRPHGVWGYYDYPGLCRPSDLDWLYAEVTALFPSIYIRYPHDAPRNARVVDGVLAGARLVRDTLALRRGRVLPMYSFAWHDYFPPSRAFLSAEDVETEFVKPALRWGLSGVVVWGISSDAHNATRCGGGPASISELVNSTVGPAIKRAADAAEACAAARCSGHGTCWAGQDGNSTLCDCDISFSGADCSVALVRGVSGAI